MHYTHGLEKLVKTNLKYATLLYGLNVEIYPAIEDFNLGLQHYGDVKYADTPIYSGKFLIPEYLYRVSGNPFGFSDFSESQYSAFSVIKFPRLAKVIVLETRELSSFIISDVKDTRDSSLASIFYEYTLIPSSQLLKRDSTEALEHINVDQEEQELDQEFNNFLISNNKQSNKPVESSVKYKKL